MKLISWNVNGLRACIQKGFLEEFARLDADFFCLQETKLQEGQLQLDLPGYHQYWCYAEKKGYSGTAIFTKHCPETVTYGIGIPELDTEGRVITLGYPEFYLVTCYTPNAQQGLARLEHRMKWEDAFRAYLITLDAKKPVILCGDLNVAHQEIDLKNPAANRGSAGFSDEERAAFGKLLECGFTDTFRHLNPTATGAYSWWSYRFNARQNNAGWRIDYFLVSDRLQEALYKTPIYSDILGSDHCPVGLELDIPCNGSIWLEKAEGTPRVVTIEATKAPKKSSKALQAGIAAGLLAIGFLTGNLLPPLFSVDPNATLSTSPNQGIMTDYASMSTQELVNLAVALKELAKYGLGANSGSVMDVAEYGKVRNTYPFLLELEFRPDAYPLLCNVRDTAKDNAQIRAAKALIVYYEVHNTDMLYASMSTQELVNLAVTIPQLISFGSPVSSTILTEGLYTALAEKNPVLYELEKRPDLESCLSRTADVDNGWVITEAQLNATYAASCLLGYYARIGLLGSNNNDIAIDHASMSTLQLVNIASQIPELAAYYEAGTRLTQETYAQLCTQNPVLYELAQREDVIDQLNRKLTLTYNTPEIVYALATLLEYFQNLPDANIDFSKLSTEELVESAVAIDELRSRTTDLNLEDYESLRSRYPVFLELERRMDLQESLEQAMNKYVLNVVSSVLPKEYVAASILYSYYTNIGLIRVDSTTPDLDYATLSTPELIELVVYEQDIVEYCRTGSDLAVMYEYFCGYPALRELDNRSDKETALAAYINDASSPALQAQVARVLLAYYATSYPLGEICWVYSETENYTVYEYTQAPVYGYSEITKPGDTAPMQTMTFEGEPLILARAPEWIRESNFWVRIETQDTYLYQSPELKINGSSPEQYEGEMLLHIIPYYDAYGTMRGLMVFGNVQKQYHLRLEYPNGSVLAFTATPTPPENATTRELLEYAINKTNLMKYIQEESEQDICTYLPLKLLLEREDFIDTAMNVYQEERVAGNDSSNSFMARITALLSRPEVEALMTSGQKDTWSMLLGQPYG